METALPFTAGTSPVHKNREPPCVLYLSGSHQGIPENVLKLQHLCRLPDDPITFIFYLGRYVKFFGEKFIFFDKKCISPNAFPKHTDDLRIHFAVEITVFLCSAVFYPLPPIRPRSTFFCNSRKKHLTLWKNHNMIR